MNTIRTGKIARLPEAVREQVNRRLDDGHPGNKLVVWLNTLPEVQAVMAAEFEGRPVRAQNLSEWRKGGYADWMIQQDAIELGRCRQAAGLSPDHALVARLAVWVSAQVKIAALGKKAADFGAAQPAPLIKSAPNRIQSC